MRMKLHGNSIFRVSTFKRFEVSRLIATLASWGPGFGEEILECGNTGDVDSGRVRFRGCHVTNYEGCSCTCRRFRDEGSSIVAEGRDEVHAQCHVQLHSILKMLIK